VHFSVSLGSKERMGSTFTLYALRSLCTTADNAPRYFRSSKGIGFLSLKMHEVKR